MFIFDTHNHNSRVVLQLLLVVTVYLVVSFFGFKGVLAYVLPPALWMLPFLTVLLLMGGLGQLSSWTYSPVVLISLLTALMQVVCLYFTALFTELGRSPYSFTPVGIAINVAYFTAPILAQETTRAYVMKFMPKNRIYAGLIFTTLLFMVFRLPVSSFISQGGPADIVKFAASGVIPAGAQSLLASYLVLIGGPLASIAYMWTLDAFNWLMPILPNPPWGLKSLISTLVPALGLVMINESVPTTKMFSAGIIGRGEVRRVRTKKVRAQRSKEVLSLVVCLVLTIMIWSTTGVLGCRVSVVASGSMRPTMDVGDVIVAVQTPVEGIKEGDVIQYWRSGLDVPITHRVIEVKSSGGSLIMVTKGDANSAPDEPILATPRQKLLKVAFTIPKVGWVSIALKSAVSSVLVYLIENPLVAYALLAVTINILVIYVLRHAIGLRRIGGKEVR